jgi:hypothetical protein
LAQASEPACLDGGRYRTKGGDEPEFNCVGMRFEAAIWMRSKKRRKAEAFRTRLASSSARRTDRKRMTIWPSSVRRAMRWKKAVPSTTHPRGEHAAAPVRACFCQARHAESASAARLNEGQSFIGNGIVTQTGGAGAAKDGL